MIRASKVADQRRRIARVIGHIEANYHRKLALKELAAVACLSLHHFLRLYVDLVGETPMDTARRLRLGDIAVALAAGKLDVAAAARKSGYGSSQAFGRAFRRQFGITPSIVRHGLLPPGLTRDETHAPKIVMLEDMPAAGIRYRGPQAGLAESLNELATTVSVAGVKLNRLRVASLGYDGAAADQAKDPEARVDVDLGVAGNPGLLADLPLTGFVMPGGAHVHLRLHDEAAADLGARARQAADQLGVHLADGPVRRLFDGDPILTPRRDAVSDFYWPLAA